MDQSRQALIIAEGTTSLTTTPEFNPEEDHRTETSFTEGSVDADYRSGFGEADTREKRKNLENYARDHYLAKTLSRIERGDGKDLTKPLRAQTGDGRGQTWQHAN